VNYDLDYILHCLVGGYWLDCLGDVFGDGVKTFTLDKVTISNINTPLETISYHAFNNQRGFRIPQMSP
jgi:hypothetical protein